MDAGIPTNAARRIVVVLLAAALAAGGAWAADDLILRAPTAEIAEIAARNGLTVVEQIAVPGDPTEGLFRVRAEEGLSTAAVISTVEELEPLVQGIEEVTLASLPELEQSVMALLDQSVMAWLDGVMDTSVLVPPVGQLGPEQLDGLDSRTIKKIKIKKGGKYGYQSKKLVLQMAEDQNSRREDITLRADFFPGCSVEYNRAVPEVEVAPALTFDGRRIEWEITNHTGAPLTVSRVDVSWPFTNQRLKRVKLQVEVEAAFEPSSVSVDFTLVGDPGDRQIGPGQAKKLFLEFEAPASVIQGEYSIAVVFAEGPSVASAPCSVVAENAPSYDRNNLEWTLTNTSHSDVVLESLNIEWPIENGSIGHVFFGPLGLEPIFISDPLPLEHFDGKNSSGRLVWTGYVDQPAVEILRVDEAQGENKGYSTVAVIDTGVDPDHWLLAQALVPGYDFVRDEAGDASEVEALLDQSVMALLDGSSHLPLEEEIVQLNQSVMALLDAEQEAELAETPLPPAFGHGTMVAGIIHRVAPYASIMPLRVFDGDGYADLLDIVEAIYYAVDHGANVIHMSFSLEKYSPELMRAINYAARSGVTCVASAGNQGQEKIVYPAAFGNTIGVASTSLLDEVSQFSNHGNDLVTVAAPGEAVVTTFPGGGWALASGTSFAAPWISGAAAIFADKNGREHRPGRSDFFLASEALTHAVAVQGPRAGRAGHGRADLKEAVDKLKNSVEFGSTGQSEVPYVILVDFAEGCSVAYPPQAFGGGCDARVGAQLELGGNKADLEITNSGEQNITVAGVQISWPQEHQDLKKIALDGDSIFEQRLPAPSARIDSGWRDPEKVERREIEPGATMFLRFEFAQDWTP